jgi:hypothetical protein
MVMLGQVWSATLGKVVLRPTDRQHWNGGAVHRTRDNPQFQGDAHL